MQTTSKYLQAQTDNKAALVPGQVAHTEAIASFAVCRLPDAVCTGVLVCKGPFARHIFGLATLAPV